TTDWSLPQQWPDRERWQQLIQRDGNTWGVPYRWGTAVLAYRHDKLRWTPSRWEDLWRPDLHQRLSLPDAPRLAIGLTLKTLGASFNDPNLVGVSGLREKLARLQSKAKYYSSRDYLQPLVLGDTWAAVGWSADVLALTRQYPNIAAIVPAEGTALWADLWVRPRQETPSDLPQRARDWLAFCGQPETAQLLERFARGTSPIAFPEIGIPALASNSEAIGRSEFLLPLSEAAWGQYRSLWSTMRLGKL
ncbi:MAG: extracellular solute-binding protein, partial [Cyanobacteria bacterium J06641_5]